MDKTHIATFAQLQIDFGERARVARLFTRDHVQDSTFLHTYL